MRLNAKRYNVNLQHNNAQNYLCSLCLLASAISINTHNYDRLRDKRQRRIAEAMKIEVADSGVMSKLNLKGW